MEPFDVVIDPVLLILSFVLGCAAWIFFDRWRARLDEAHLRACLPRCGLESADGSERRTCSCRGPRDCQPDVRELTRALRTRRLTDLPRRPITELAQRDEVRERALADTQARAGGVPIHVVTLHNPGKDENP